MVTQQPEYSQSLHHVSVCLRSIQESRYSAVFASAVVVSEFQFNSVAWKAAWLNTADVHGQLSICCVLLLSLI